MTLSVDQVLSKAKRHARRGETDLAAQQYQSVLEKFPKNKRAIDGLKNLRQPNKGNRVTGAEPSQMQLNGLITTYNQGNLQAALEQGEALAKQFPSAAFIPNLLGVVNADLGQLERAVACHTSAVQMMPDFAEAHYNLGNVLNSLGKPEEAVASLTRAVQIKPDFAEAHNNLGNALNALGKPEEAVSSFTKALQIEPALAEVHYNLGAAFITLGKHEEAVTSLTKAVQINPDYAEAHNNLGTALNVLGRPEEALPSLTSAVRIKPDFAEAHNNLGNAFNALGKHEQAVASLTKAVQIIPEYAEAHNNLGAAQNDLGRHDEALAHYRKAVSLAPDRKEFWHNFSVRLGAISFDVYDQEWADIYLGLLAQKTVARPSMVAKSILGLVKQHPSIRKALQFSTGDDGKISPFDVCSSLSDVPLFLHIIKLSPVPDLEVEDLLRGLRSALLFNGDVAVDRERLLGFQVSLALHCFANEFVFGETDEETLAVKALEATI